MSVPVRVVYALLGALFIAPMFVPLFARLSDNFQLVQLLSFPPALLMLGAFAGMSSFKPWGWQMAVLCHVLLLAGNTLVLIGASYWALHESTAWWNFDTLIGRIGMAITIPLEILFIVVLTRLLKPWNREKYFPSLAS
jgi:hypothetical protein